MKTVICLLLVMASTVSCFAETIVIYNPKNNEVYSLSNQDDAVMPDGYIKTSIKEDMKDLDLIYPANFYKYQNKNLITNRQKLEDAAQKEDIERKKIEQEKIIQDRIRKIAVDSLKSEGVTITEE